MISRKLRNSLDREGRKKGYRVIGVGRGMGQDDKEHLHIVLDYDHAISEDLQEVYIPGFWCKLSIHDWGFWGEPMSSFAGVLLGKLKQTRSCLLCNIHQVKNL